MFKDMIKRPFPFFFIVYSRSYFINAPVLLTGISNGDLNVKECVKLNIGRRYNRATKS